MNWRFSAKRLSEISASCSSDPREPAGRSGTPAESFGGGDMVMRAGQDDCGLTESSLDKRVRPFLQGFRCESNCVGGTKKLHYLPLSPRSLDTATVPRRSGRKTGAKSTHHSRNHHPEFTSQDKHCKFEGLSTVNSITIDDQAIKYDVSF